MPNRLARSTSPYLQQHAANPVDWFEWGDEAFDEARRRDVPVLVSVGYAACHWCHVMAHESFEDPTTAATLNERFVCVKVDREERPDIDAVYMEVTQALTGRGGWPMTVFATPDGTPFFAGTYFPPRAMGGLPSFGQVLDAVAEGWRDQRERLLEGAAQIRDVLAGDRRGEGAAPAGLPHGALDESLLERGLEALGRSYDTAHGGFGGAPKFPPSMVLEWLLRRHARTGDLTCLAMAAGTLEAMARGGMADQLTGGFARYSVDAGWVVPHFEKMLYDNALLMRVYAHWWRATGSPLAARVVEGTASLLLTELRTPEGAFASSLDADSVPADGGPAREGAYYVWTPAELSAALPAADAAWAAALLGVTATGTFEHGTSVLQLAAEPDDADRWARVRAALARTRAARPRPGRDDKVVASWNGLAIAALADAGALLGRPAWITAAREAADLILRTHLTGAPGAVRLARVSRDGVAGAAAGVLEDYADVAEGLLALASATGEGAWVRTAGTLLDTVLDHFADGSGGFHDTHDDETDPVLARLRRPRDVGDGPTPAGQAAAAGALLTYAALTGSARHREAAEHALAEPLLVAARYPRAAGWAAAVAEAVLDGPREVAVVGPPDDPATDALRLTAARATAPGLVLAVGRPDASGGPDGDDGDVVPLLRGRTAVGGLPTAYVCRGFVCDRPTTDPAELAAQLTR